MTTRPPRNVPQSPDEKVIRAHMELIEKDMEAANSFMSDANSSANMAREFAKNFPALKSKVTEVTDKIAAMATKYGEAEKAYRVAKIAAASGQKGVVASKATEVSNCLGELKTLDGERATRFETAQKAVEKAQALKAIVDEITGIQTGVQELVTTATERATAAQRAVDQARAKLPVDKLTGRVKTAAEAAQSLSSSVREADARLHDANSAVSALQPHLTDVNTALADANTAAASGSKADADAALQRAKVAKQEADKVAADAGIAEKDGESPTTPQTPAASSPDTTTPTEQDSVERLLEGGFWGRMFILLLLGAAILLVAPQSIKWLAGVAWIVLVAASFAPAIRRSPKWKGGFWALTVGLLLFVLIAKVSPVFGPNPVAETVKGNVPGLNQEPAPTPTPTWKLK